MEPRGEQRETTQQWAEQTLGSAHLGDERRNKRAVAVLATIADHAGVSLPAACGHDDGRYERLARYVRDSNTRPEALIAAGCEATAGQLEAVKGDIVVAGDTTTLSYAHRSALGSLGPVGGPRDAKSRGILVHNALAVAADSGQVLGLLDQMYACRDEATHGRKHQRRQRGYEDKESVKWEASFRNVWQRVTSVAPRVVFVNDREADVYEYLMALVDEQARFVVRAQQDRRLQTAEGSLSGAIAATPVMGHVRLWMPQKGGRAAHTVRLALRACSVTLLPPKHAVEALPSLPVNVVRLEQVDAADAANRISWTLCTSEPVATLAQMLAIVKLYVLRWPVEEFHKCWKADGTRVEDLRLQARDNLLRVAVVMALAAVRIMNLRDSYLHDQFHKRLPQPEPPLKLPAAPPSQRPSRLCTAVLSRIEWQVLWLKIDPAKPLPPKPPSVAWAMRSIARLAGWMDTKRTGRPGYRTLWTGYTKLTDAVDAVRLAHLLETSDQK